MKRIVYVPVAVVVLAGVTAYTAHAFGQIASGPTRLTHSLDTTLSASDRKKTTRAANVSEPMLSIPGRADSKQTWPTVDHRVDLARAINGAAIQGQQSGQGDRYGLGAHPCLRYRDGGSRAAGAERISGRGKPHPEEPVESDKLSVVNSRCVIPNASLGRGCDSTPPATTGSLSSARRVRRQRGGAVLLRVRSSRRRSNFSRVQWLMNCARAPFGSLPGMGSDMPH